MKAMKSTKIWCVKKGGISDHHFSLPLMCVCWSGSRSDATWRCCKSAWKPSYSLKVNLVLEKGISDHHFSVPLMLMCLSGRRSGATWRCCKSCTCTSPTSCPGCPPPDPWPPTGWCPTRYTHRSGSPVVDQPPSFKNVFLPVLKTVNMCNDWH